VKTCTGCNETKPLTEFFRDRSNKQGHMARCKPCKMAAHKRYVKAVGYDRKRYWANGDSERQRHLLKKYGVTFAIYRLMLAEQHGRCAICSRPEPASRMFDVDHDHATGKVRGLLCTSCNRVLGHAGDSPERLRSAADYLSSRKSPRK
jgi:hypothetical protein